FGYRRGLSKYESIDEDELLASLTAEELKELERELEDIEPDHSLPVGQRQKSLTEKTPTGTFSREALMAYWEKESQKLLEKERLGECRKMWALVSKSLHPALSALSPGPSADSQLLLSNVNLSIIISYLGKGSSMLNHSHHQTLGVKNVLRNEKLNDVYHTLQVAEEDKEERNPTVIEDALEKIKNNDPDTIEVNLNNIENITSQTLTRFAEALKDNTVVKTFSLANTRADDNAAVAIAKMLRVNEHITSINIESNFVTGKGILAIMRALQHNTVLSELRFHNQRHIMGSQVEMEIVKLLRRHTLLRLGY
uniref:Leiomodin 2 n=1 Tax=Loxodonta africana TaxID=9785 RepID=G5E729_LOXAF